MDELSQNKPDNYHRRSIRLKGYDYSLEGAYFVTIPTFNREHLFGDVGDEVMLFNIYGKIAYEQWLNLPKRFHGCNFEPFVIMPNHLHGIIHIDQGNHRRGVGEESDQPAPGIRPLRPTIPSDPSRGAGVVFDQQTPGIQPLRPYAGHNILSGSLGAIVRAYKASVSFRIHAIRGDHTSPVWQRNYYEHIIRDETEYESICDYIETNPLNWKEDRFNTVH